MIALMIAGLSGQERAYAPSSELYAPPAVRPFEPPSDFGRQFAEGDADATVRRTPIPAPVAVEDYSHSYEGGRSNREISYEQGVAQARAAADARMGPLDGAWRITGANGEAVLDLVLSDRDPDKPVEGAWSRATSRDARTFGPVNAITRDGLAVMIDVSADGRPLTLRLQAAAAGWTGVLTEAGRDRPVSMARPG